MSPVKEAREAKEPRQDRLDWGMQNGGRGGGVKTARAFAPFAFVAGQPVFLSASIRFRVHRRESRDHRHDLVHTTI